MIPSLENEAHNSVQEMGPMIGPKIEVLDFEYRLSDHIKTKNKKRRRKKREGRFSVHSHNILHRSSLASIGSLGKRVLSPIHDEERKPIKNARHKTPTVELNYEGPFASSFISKDGDDSESIKEALEAVPQAFSP